MSCCRRTRSFTTSPPSITNSKIACTNSPPSTTSQNPNKLEEVNLKKRKLQLKDRMEDIMRAAPGPSHVVDVERCAAEPSRARLRARELDAVRSRRVPVHRRRAGWSLLSACRDRLDAGASRSWRSAGSSPFFFRDPERRSPDAGARGAVAGGRPRAGRRRLAQRRARDAAGRRGSRSAFFCRRWTSTSTASRHRAGSRASTTSRGDFCRRITTTPAAANERSEIWIDHRRRRRSSRGRSSAFWRDASCAACKPVRDVRAGDRYGIMKFGSRMDIFVPSTARVTVKVGETVRGGETIIAVLH